MSILSVANVHFETTGANRIEYREANGQLSIITSGNIAITSRNFTLSNNAGLAGNVLTSNGTTWISQAPTVTAQPGTSGNVLTSNGTSWVSSVYLPSRLNTSVISANTNAVSGGFYVATTTLTLTLPGSPTVGDVIGLSNMSGNVDLVVARNSSNVAGLAENLTIDQKYASIILQYSGIDKGWVFA